MLVDPTSQKPTKIRYGFLEDGSKVRIAKRSGSVIPKPDRSHLTYINRTKNRKEGIHDTRGDLVLEKTYTGEDFMQVKYEFEQYLAIKINEANVFGDLNDGGDAAVWVECKWGGLSKKTR